MKFSEFYRYIFDEIDFYNFKINREIQDIVACNFFTQSFDIIYCIS